MWWMLAREVLFIKGKITRQTGFVLEDKEIMPDLYFYRDPEEAEKEEQAEVRGEEAKEDRWGQTIAPEAAVREEVTAYTVSALNWTHQNRIACSVHFERDVHMFEYFA